MTRSPVKPPIAPTPSRTLNELEAGVRRLTQRRDELEAYDVRSAVDWNPPALDALSASITSTLARVFGENTSEFNRFKRAGDLAYSPSIIFREVEIFEVRSFIAEHIATGRELLTTAIQLIREQIADRGEVSVPTTMLEKDALLSKNKVFVVHGHDDAAKHSIARFLEQIGIEALVLQEQPNQGFTIIEKFQHHANEVGFAVVLLTPDDVAAPASTPASTTRARQNVIFELGYFVCKLGRGRVCLMRKGDVEIPSDLYGVIYTDLDASDGWKIKLVRELKASKLEFDGSKVW